MGSLEFFDNPIGHVALCSRNPQHSPLHELVEMLEMDVGFVEYDDFSVTEVIA